MRYGTRKCSFLVAEQLALQQGFRYRSTVYRYKGSVSPCALAVDRVGNEFLAGSAFSKDKYGNIGFGDLVNRRKDRFHHGARANHSLEWKPVFGAVYL